MDRPFPPLSLVDTLNRARDWPSSQVILKAHPERLPHRPTRTQEGQRADGEAQHGHIQCIHSGPLIPCPGGERA